MHLRIVALCLRFNAMHLTVYLTEPHIVMLRAALENGYVEGTVIDAFVLLHTLSLEGLLLDQ